MQSREQTRQRIEELMGQLFLNMRPQVSELRPLMELTMPQLRTLVVLHARGPLRISHIAAQLGVGMPAVTSLVSKLEEKGMVLREHDTQDRRVVRCSVTEQGRSEVESFWRPGRERMAQMTAMLSDEDLELVARAMEVMVAVAERSSGAGEDPEPSEESATRDDDREDR